LIDEDDLYIDRVELAARGWTMPLIRRFLPTPDRWATVDHWRNCMGKATYFVEKVIATEQLAEFKEKFSKSTLRRRLSRREVNAFMCARARVDGKYRSWIKSVSPDDVRRMVVVDEVVVTCSIFPSHSLLEDSPVLIRFLFRSHWKF
jgi:hypothetical protein